MATYQTITITSQFGIELEHNYIQQASSTKLIILLPGKGYTIDSPLMRYVGQIGQGQGYDVLYIRYGIHMTPVENWMSRIPDIHADTQAVVSQIMSSQYQKVCVVGKSLGTLIATQLMSILDSPKRSALMLTPIQNAMSMLGDIPALGIIGTADPAYDPDIIQSTATQSWKVYENLNHSLEVSGDWKRSIQILPDILQHCETFLS